MERMRALTLFAFEVALGVEARNGAVLPDDVRWLLAMLALGDPATAVHLPHVRAALDPPVLATVRRLAPGRVTPVAGRASHPPPSMVKEAVPVSEAARLLGLTPHAVRAACRRGSLPGTKNAAGDWVISRAAAIEYGRTHAKDTG
jgi:hypothetical protein